jgi:type II secretory pathway pseudopilin PulG
MKNKNKNKGFTIIELLLVFSVIFFISSIGIYISKKEKPTNNSKKPVDQTKHIDIKEWGVKIALSDKADNVKYSVDNKKTPTEIAFTSDDLDNFVKKNPECVNANHFVHLSRTKDKKISR